MIHSLTGTVLDTQKDSIILDNGHNCSFLIQALDIDRVLGISGRFYVHFYMRQDHISLYGFRDEETLKLFKILIMVKGCGPKTALNILNHIDVARFVEVINLQKQVVLEGIPGIGKRMAAQLILDLKGKLKDFKADSSPIFDVSAIMNSLYQLGYRKDLCDQVYQTMDLSVSYDEQGFLKAMLKGLHQVNR